MDLLTNPHPTEFTTERLIIRRCEVAFADALYEAARESIATVHPFLPWCHPDYQKHESVEWLAHCEQEWQQGRTYAFTIFDQQGRLLGGCGVNRFDGHPVVNLGYWLRSSATGQGYATEATISLAQFSLKQLGFKRVEIIMATHNQASRQVAIKAGAVYEGELINRLELHGTVYNAYIYSITN